MATYQPRLALSGSEPGPWGEPVAISYVERDVLLYAIGIGIADLRYVWEAEPRFAVFPTFPIRWGGLGLAIDPQAIPPSPGPLNIDAEREIECLHPLPLSGTVKVASRLTSVQPRGKGNALVEVESVVTDASGRACVRMHSASFRRGVAALGDIEPFEGQGRSRSVKLEAPSRAPDYVITAVIAPNQAHVYRLSGDWNPLHIDPAAAQFGGFPAPILHGLCTYGHCGQLLLGLFADNDAARFRRLRVRFSSPVYPGDTLRVLAWRDGPGRVQFEARVGERVVVSNAFFEHS